VTSIANVRRGIRYALATGPNPLAGWVEYQGPTEAFPGDSGGVAEKSWAVSVPLTRVQDGERTMRRQEGAYCQSDVVLHWCRLMRMAGTTYDLDDALETEQAILAWVHEHYPCPPVTLNLPGHPDHGKVCGGVQLAELSFERAEFALQIGNNQVSYYLQGTIRYLWTHPYDWPHQPPPTP
jgi:hypothetical protein